MRSQLPVSERRACAVVGQARATQRRRPEVRDDEAALTSAIERLATRYGRYGYRRIRRLLVDEGWRVNVKRVYRIWRREGLKVPSKQPKRGRLWLNDGSCVRLRPERPNHVWSYDFVADRTHDGKAFRMLCIIDEFSRECLAIKVARKLKATDVIEASVRLRYARTDQGIEVPFDDAAAMRVAFEAAHRQQYGFLGQDDLVADLMRVEAVAHAAAVVAPPALGLASAFFRNMYRVLPNISRSGASVMRLPRPGTPNTFSTTSAPPMRAPTLRPATVSRVRLEGRRAWRQRMRRVGMPFALAVVMKSSCSVAIMSARGMPFSFSMYSRTERISLLIGI